MMSRGMLVWWVTLAASAGVVGGLALAGAVDMAFAAGVFIAVTRGVQLYTWMRMGWPG